MICQACGIEAATRHVSFHQNIGVLVMRFSKSVEGSLCKRCIHSNFWSLTTTTFFLGWWGTISLFLTPCFLLNNTFRYLGCLGMPPVPPEATPPVLTSQAVERLNPHAERMMNRLGDGESLEVVARDTAAYAAVTPAQVMLYLRALAQANGKR